MKTKGIYLLYRIIQVFGLPALLLYFAVRSFRDRRYFRTLWRRLGFLPATLRQTVPGSIWLHAVSVGEVLTSVELVRQLRARIPGAPVFVSASTLAGRAAAEQKLAGLAQVFYAPVDYTFAVRRVLRTLRPAAVIVAETEIWPNLYRETRRSGAALLLVNARISDRAASRYRYWSWFFGPVLAHADAILAQNETMRARFEAAGAPAGIVQVAGNLKYDARPQEAPPDSPVIGLLARLRPAAVWIAASTMPPAEVGDVDEDDAVIGAFRQLARPGLLLIHVPRRPERFDVVAARLTAAGIPFLRRSCLNGSEGLALPGVLLLDSIGELSGLFARADVVFMGGTLAHRGGHNILEPAFFARPIVIGRHMENFEEIASEFRAAGAVAEIRSADELASAVNRMLREPGETGLRALACAEARRGATARAVEEIVTQYRRHLPKFRPVQPVFAVLWLLSRLWLQGGRWKRGRDLEVRQHLQVPVVSVGNISMGGTGKTPFVQFLVDAVRRAGIRPGILTRGYGRRSPENVLVLDAWECAPVERTGDEPQIFLRSCAAPVGIGRNRAAAGELLGRRFPIDLMILDDGFQHHRLERQVDLVLVDALNPFGGREIFPLGRLREPLDGLGRAHAFVITRSHLSTLVPAIEDELRRHNSTAPIYHARVVPQAWVDFETTQPVPLEDVPFSIATAFCGLGNPESFWRTLESLGIRPAGKFVFPDHHPYGPKEILRMVAHARAAGADALLTTEKDVVNLCEGCAGLLRGLKLYWLRIRMEVEREGELLALLTAAGPPHGAR